MDKPNFNIVVTNTETAPCCLTLNIEVAAADVQKTYDDTLLALNKQIKLPGFRSGKIPKNIILARYSKELEAETMDKLINKALRKAVEDQKLELAGSPEIAQDCKPELKLGEAFKFALTCETLPKFDLPTYKGLHLTKADTSISQEELDDAINSFLEQNIDYKQIDQAAAQKDMLKCDYTATIPEGTEFSDKCKYLLKGENSWLVLREPELLPGVSTVLVGTKPGDEKDADITFPKDHYNTELAGKTLKYHFKINEVHTAVVPEMTDEFAKKFNMESAQALKDAYQKNMQARKEQIEKEKMSSQVVDALLATSDFALPPSLVKQEAARFKQQAVEREKRAGKKDDELKAMDDELEKQADTNARNALRREFILSQIAKDEKVEVTFNDVMPIVSEIAQREKKNIQNTVKALRDNGQLNAIYSSLMLTKAIDKVIELAEVTVVKDEA